MILTIWERAATAPAALAASIVAIALLFLLRRHRDANGQTSPQKIVACMLFTLISYILIAVIAGTFFLHIPVSTIIRDHIGDDRMAWLFVGLLADILARLVRIFDPD
jgi:hypothetical protein